MLDCTTKSSTKSHYSFYIFCLKPGVREHVGLGNMLDCTPKSSPRIYLVSSHGEGTCRVKLPVPTQNPLFYKAGWQNILGCAPIPVRESNMLQGMVEEHSGFYLSCPVFQTKVKEHVELYSQSWILNFLCSTDIRVGEYFLYSQP